jgi:hypothetical protein
MGRIDLAMRGVRMTPERIAQIRAEFPWLPADYLRILSRVPAGSATSRYGVQWFDGPESPGDAFGAALAAQFPSALWIARRGGNPVGYAGWDAGHPRLYEWAGSQRKVVHRFDGIAALVLASILTPGYDGRPLAPFALQVPGLALGPWHDAGTQYIAHCILLPDEEAGVIDALHAGAAAGWELCLSRDDNNSWLSIQPLPGGFELRLDRHGCGGQWQHATAEVALAALLALAPFNDGVHPAYHALLSVPVPAGDRK